MKKITKLSIIIFSFMCLFAIGFSFVNFSTKTATASPLAQDYLISQEVTSSNIKINENDADGISIVHQQASNSNLVSFIKIYVTDWTNIEHLQVKRMILNTVQSVSTDDAATPINSSSNEFYFNQNGIYMVEYTISGVKKAIYTNYFFEREYSLSALVVTNGTFFMEHYFNTETANVIIGDNDISTDGKKVILSYTSINSNLYECSFSSNNISTNQTSTLTIHKKNNSSLKFFEIDLEVYCNFPSFSHTNNGVAISEVFQDIEESSRPNTNNKLFYNQEITVSPNYTGLNEELLTKRFYFQSTTNKNTITSTYTLKNSETIIKSETAVICQNPSETIELRLGSSTSTILYPNLNSSTEPIYSFTPIYPHAINDTVYDLGDTIDYGNRRIIYGYLKSDPIKKAVVFAYNFEYHEYNQSNAEITVATTSNPGEIKITKKETELPPIDLFIIGSNERFEFKDVFQDSTGNTITVNISEAGIYRIVVTYRGVSDEDMNDTFYHPSFNYTVPGKALYVSCNGQPILNGEITNGPVRIYAQEIGNSESTQAQYTVYRNLNELGTYNQQYQFSDEGYYTVTNGTEIYHFTIISKSAKNAFTASSYENATLLSFTNNGSTTVVENNVTFTRSGSYTLNYQLTVPFNITVDGNAKNITSIKIFSINVKILKPVFSVDATVKNGGRTSDDVVINKINANGNYTVEIKHNNKTTTYSSAQFEKLSQKQRTLTKNGNYQITITDESGNQYLFSFEKYYEVSAILIILIVILIAGLSVVAFIIIRLRLKSKVK